MSIHSSHCSARLHPGIIVVLAILAMAMPALVSAEGRATISSNDKEDDRHYLVTARCSGSTASSFGIKLSCVPPKVYFFDADFKSSGKISLATFLEKLKKASGRPYGLMVGKANSGEGEVEQGFRLFNVTYDSASKTLDLDIVHVAGTWPGLKGIVLKPVKLRRLDLYFHPLKFAKFLPAAKPEHPYNETLLLGPGAGSGKKIPSAGSASGVSGRKLQQQAGASLQPERSGRKLQQHGRKLQAGADIWATSPLTIFHAHVHKHGKVSMKCASTVTAGKSKCTVTIEVDLGLKESTWMASQKPIWVKHGVDKYVSTFRQSYTTNQDVVGLGKIIPKGAGKPPVRSNVFGFNLVDMTYTAGASSAVVTYTIELHVQDPTGALPTWINYYAEPAVASLFMFQSNPKTKEQASTRSAAEPAGVTPAFDSVTDCATVKELSGTSCSANYLGTAFSVLAAFPYPGVATAPGGQSNNGVSLSPTSTVQSRYMFNNPIFTYDSLAANKREGATSCIGTMQVETSQTASDTRTSVAVSASVSVEYWGVTGTASANYQTNTETMSQGSYSMTTAKLTCEMASYNLPIDMGLYELTASFIEHAQTVVENSYDTDTLYSFYRSFGSHWVDSVVLGDGPCQHSV